jgi:hypothetical protein
MGEGAVEPTDIVTEVPDDRPHRLRRSGQLRIDLFDAAVLVALAGLSVWLLAFLLSKAGPNHVWTGTAGPYIGDQLQYLGWIQEAYHHVRIPNPFDSVPGPADYLNPALIVSGLVERLGVSASTSYLLWTPVAVLSLFGAARAVCRGTLSGTAQRRAALVLALFYISPAAVLTHHPSWLPAIDRYYLPVVSREMWVVLYLWGYQFTAIAVASLALCLLAYERDHTRRRLRPWAPLAGLVCAWMQPWQGVTVLGVLVVSEAVMWRRGDRGHGPLVLATCVATGVPLVYYSALGHLDPAWALAGRQNFIVVPFLAVLVAIVPLGLPAILAYRLPAPSLRGVMLRAWPLVALGLYWTIAWTHIGTYPLHALQGLSIPLACLAVMGVSSIGLTVPAVLKTTMGAGLVLLLLLPAGVQNLNDARSVGASYYFAQDPYFITSGEEHALEYLRQDAVSGPVLATLYLGQTVPAETGRQTWVGNISWTPDYTGRIAQADALFSGGLQRTQAVHLVQTSMARFLLADCQDHADLSALLAPILTSVRHFGCATVYQVSKSD